MPVENVALIESLRRDFAAGNGTRAAGSGLMSVARRWRRRKDADRAGRDFCARVSALGTLSVRGLNFGCGRACSTFGAPQTGRHIAALVRASKTAGGPVA